MNKHEKQQKNNQEDAGWNWRIKITQALIVSKLIFHCGVKLFRPMFDYPIRNKVIFADQVLRPTSKTDDPTSGDTLVQSSWTTTER